MIFFLTFIFIVIAQRIGELFWAKRNGRILFSSGGIEIDRIGYKYIVVMHSLFFVSLLSEYILIKKNPPELWYVFFLLFVFAQVLRYWSIISLGNFWNTRIIVVPGMQRINKGPYKYFTHPNYAAVVTEIAVIPLIFGCIFTASVFSLLNILLIYRRIRIENRELRKYCLK